jgi:hypothetical protein
MDGEFGRSPNFFHLLTFVKLCRSCSGSAAGPTLIASHILQRTFADKAIQAVFALLSDSRVLDILDPIATPAIT